MLLVNNRTDLKYRTIFSIFMFLVEVQREPARLQLRLPVATWRLAALATNVILRDDLEGPFLFLGDKNSRGNACQVEFPSFL
jgi:hypothetical protein